jgi:HlyD family secretion protein
MREAEPLREVRRASTVTGGADRSPRWLLLAVSVVAAALVVLVVRHFRNGPDVRVTSAEVTSGPIARSLTTTGRFEPARAVAVGVQVSGTIQSIDVDFNSRVRAGQVIARLDPSTFDAEVTKAVGAVTQGEADLERLRIVAEDARTKLSRAQALAANDLITAADLETAQVALRQAEAEWKAQEAEVRSRRALLRQARVNRDHTIIRAPIDGIVINRNVEVGQTLAASVESPVLVTIADLTRMPLFAEVHEADLGGVQPGTPVTFDVDSLDGERFEGRVALVRLQPIVEQPAAASATTPAGTAATTGTTPPGTTATTSSAPATSSAAATTSSPGASGRGSSTTTAATPANAAAGSTGTTSSAGSGVVSYTAVVDVTRMAGPLKPGSTAIVTLAGPGRDSVVRIPNRALAFRPTPDVLAALGQDEPPLERPDPSSEATLGRPRRVWKYEGGRLVSVSVRTGLTDEQWTELLSGALRPGDRVVTGAVVE